VTKILRLVYLAMETLNSNSIRQIHWHHTSQTYNIQDKQNKKYKRSNSILVSLVFVP